MANAKIAVFIERSGDKSWDLVDSLGRVRAAGFFSFTAMQRWVRDDGRFIIMKREPSEEETTDVAR